MPSIGTTVPSPSVLAVSLCQSESVIQNVAKLCTGASDVESSFDATCLAPLNLCNGSVYVCKTYLLSISDDGKIWRWLLTNDKAKDARKPLNMTTINVSGETGSEKHTASSDSLLEVVADVVKKSEPPVSNSSFQQFNSTVDHFIKVN